MSLCSNNNRSHVPLSKGLSMFTRLRGIPTPIWALIVIAACFGLWHALPESLRNQIQPTAHAATFTVNTVDDHDDGVCSAADCTLREAINAANNSGGIRFIGFNISGSGVHTINLSSPLPQFTKAIDIDGGSLNGNPLIEINGANAGGANGLSLGSGSDFSIIAGLIINRFSGFGISVNSNDDTIFGNFIGTNAAGTAAAPNGAGGIRINGD